MHVCLDLPQTSVGVRAADGERGGHDLCQLEGAHHVQHQAAQVKRNNTYHCYTLMHTVRFVSCGRHLHLTRFAKHKSDVIGFEVIVILKIIFALQSSAAWNDAGK